MDKIHFYHWPPTSKKREQPTSTGSTSTSRPVFEISGPSGTGSDHARNDQAASHGRFQQPTASFVAAIGLSVDGELAGASSSDSRPAKNVLGSAVGNLVHETSPSDSPHSQTPGARLGPDIIESTETTQLPLHQNSAVGVYIEEPNNQTVDLEQETQSVGSFLDIQHDSCPAHISAADAHAQLQQPSSMQIPHLNDNRSSASLEIHAEQDRRAVDDPDESRNMYEPLADSAQVVGPTSALDLDPNLPDGVPDHAGRRVVGPRSRRTDSNNSGHGSVAVNAPRISMDVHPQSSPTPAISCTDKSRTQPTTPPLSSAINPPEQDMDECSEAAAMPPRSFIPQNRTTEHDLSFYPLSPTDAYLLTAVANGLQELQQMSASPDAWIGAQNLSASDHFMILSIKPLGYERWLLLAKVSWLTHTGSGPSDGGDQTKQTRKIVGNRCTHVNTHRRRLPGNSANGRHSCLKRGKWRESEDQELSSMVESGVSWSSIFARFPRRTEAAVRSRWNVVLKPLAL